MDDEKAKGTTATFQRTTFGPGDGTCMVSSDDGVTTLIVGLPERLGPIPSRTYWRMSFDFEPPRFLTPAEREAMQYAVATAVRAFLDALPSEPQR